MAAISEYPTFAIVDGSEIFYLRLHHSNLLHGTTIKQHNTVKFLVACINPFHAPY